MDGLLHVLDLTGRTIAALQQKVREMEEQIAQQRQTIERLTADKADKPAT